MIGYPSSRRTPERDPCLSRQGISWDSIRPEEIGRTGLKRSGDTELVVGGYMPSAYVGHLFRIGPAHAIFDLVDCIDLNPLCSSLSAISDYRVIVRSSFSYSWQL